MGNNKSKVKRTLSNSSKKHHHNSQYLLSKESESRNLYKEKELTYYLSNHDDEDIDRQHFNHFFRKHIFQNNFSVPIEERLIQGGCKVLDIGCGPGSWLLDLASKYENSYFFGIDIKPVYPKEIKPENLEFCEADIFNGLPFPDNEFDFVHQEVMSFIIKADQWNYVISELIRVTKPGGFIEIVEYISPENSGPVLANVYKIHFDLCLQRGVDMSLIPNLDKIIESHQNISQVYRDERSFIIGPNGGKAGLIIQDIIITFNTSDLATDDISSKKGISKEEYKNMALRDFKNELKITKPKLKVCRFWAQKNA
ncbi:S-adenosyl-L-methionine-dependent methyltransferase [Rhizophagus diaphanus]|nr:S-adenosyl-L-methionine-dependent methyltransferase [Rhizophagus diaphanus] [Rhizophagus sp. MUCL 43196]